MAHKKHRKSKKGCHCPRGSKPNGNHGCYKTTRKGARSVAKVCRPRKRR